MRSEHVPIGELEPAHAVVFAAVVFAVVVFAVVGGWPLSLG